MATAASLSVGSLLSLSGLCSTSHKRGASVCFLTGVWYLYIQATSASLSVTSLLSLSGSKHTKGSKERCLLGQNSMRIFGVIPFIKLQNDA